MMGEGSYIWGSRFFELSNHLGNVLATIQDRMTVTNASGVDYNDLVVVSAQDYYAFGMMMPGRSYSAPGGGYRYGFNGKEKAREITSDDYDFGARIYDPRIGRFLSVDPLQTKYPDVSPYLFAANNPIVNIDQDGKYALFIHYMLTRYMLMQAGVSEVQANLIAHYASVYSDNPGAIRNFSEYKSYSKADLIIAKNIKDSQKDNPIFAEIGGKVSEEKVRYGVTYNTDIDYSRTVNSQSEGAEA